MKRLVIVICAVAMAVPAFAQSKQKIDDRIDSAQEVLNQVCPPPINKSRTRF